MNIRELKEIIKDLPDDMEVVVRYDNDWGDTTDIGIDQYRVDGWSRTFFLGEEQVFLDFAFKKVK